VLRRSKYHFGFAALVALTTAFTAAPASAQECGDDCVPCGAIDSFIGVWTDGGLAFLDTTQCSYGTGDCEGCYRTVGDQTPLGTEILRAVESASEADLAQLLDAYGDRLLFHPKRNVLAVRGTTCSTEALAAVLYVNGEKAAALRRLGVDLLE